jgi:hypothetical protein
MSKFLPWEVRQTVVRNGQFSTCVLDEASTFQVAKQIAWRSHNGNPTTCIHNALSGETFENRHGDWRLIK